MGPSSAARLLRIRGLTKSLLGRVTAAESTCMPNTMRVNWTVRSAPMFRAHPEQRFLRLIRLRSILP